MTHKNAAVAHIKPMDNEEAVPSRRQKMLAIAPKLVAIEAWCRREGLSDIARKLEPAVDAVERALTHERDAAE